MTTAQAPAVVVDYALRMVGGARLSEAASKAASTDPAELLRRWFSALSPASVRKYRQALNTFGQWAIVEGDRGPEAVMRLLCECGPAAAHAMAEQWRDELLAAGKAPSTVAGLLSAIASLVRACRRVGLVAWSLEDVAPKPEKRCDRRGPPRHEVELLLARVDEKAAAGDRRALRDAGILRLLHNAALRRAEVCGLQFPRDLDLDGDGGAAVWPKRKGRTERTRVVIGQAAARSLREWIGCKAGGGTQLGGPSLAFGSGIERVGAFDSSLRRDALGFDAELRRHLEQVARAGERVDVAGRGLAGRHRDARRTANPAPQDRATVFGGLVHRACPRTWDSAASMIAALGSGDRGATISAARRAGVSKDNATSSSSVARSSGSTAASFLATRDSHSRAAITSPPSAQWRSASSTCQVASAMSKPSRILVSTSARTSMPRGRPGPGWQPGRNRPFGSRCGCRAIA